MFESIERMWKRGRKVSDGNKEQKKALNQGCLWRKRWLMDTTMKRSKELSNEK